MELYFSYLFLHYLGSLTFLAETSLTISKKLSLVYDACQKYTVLVEYILKRYQSCKSEYLCNETNSSTEQIKSKIKFCSQLHQPKSEEFLLVVHNFNSNSKIYYNFILIVVFVFPKCQAYVIFWVCCKLKSSQIIFFFQFQVHSIPTLQ